MSENFYDHHNNLAAIAAELKHLNKNIDQQTELSRNLIQELKKMTKAISEIGIACKSVVTDENWNYTGVLQMELGVNRK